MGNLTANSKTANVQVTLQAPTETEATISINQHYEASFLVEDIARVQSNYDLKKLIGSLYRKVVDKFLKLRVTLYETIRSQTQKWGGSTTIIGTPFVYG